MPLIPAKHKMDLWTPAMVLDFVTEHITAGRLVLSAANYDHEALVKLAESALGSLPAGADVSMEEARYTGGGSQIAGPGQATVAIGFDGVSWQDEDLVPVCVLHTLLGGGGSFSSGGPGKGMYTRLYSQVLNQHAWVTAATAFNHCYGDAGIFGIQASCVDASMLDQLVEVVGSQVVGMAGALAPGELDRAKAMTKSSLIMNLESKAIVCEDLGRQILSSGAYRGPEELVSSIEAVGEDDLRRVARRLLKSTPSVVTYGEEVSSQDYSAIESAIKSQTKLAA